MSESNLKNVFYTICGDKVIMSGEDIKKFVFHDSAVHEQILNEYFDGIGMKYEENVNFNDFVNLIKNNCKLKEKDEGKTKTKKQESRYEFKGPVIVEKEDSVSDDVSSDEEIVDLGPDENYIYVDHSHDDERYYPEEEKIIFGFEEETEQVDDNTSVNRESENDLEKNSNVDQENENRASHVKSVISDAVIGKTRLQSENNDEDLSKPSLRDEPAEDSEITNDENLFDDDTELNIFNDELPDLHNSHDNVLNIVDEAKEGYLDDDIFDDEELNFQVHNQPVRNVEYDDNNDLGNDSSSHDIQYNESDIQNNESIEKTDSKVTDEYIGDGINYYKGSNDINSKLRKNNLYYEENKPRTVKDSIKGIRKDMKYINKSLKEIENPTQIDYVSVVDRTEEYNPEDYLNRPSDDDSDKIIAREEGLTFAEKEEQRIEEEMKREALEKEIESDENVIVTVNEQQMREEIQDQALEEIIQSADEDYKEIEKERFNENNKLKSYDNQKLPGKKKLEDNIVDYVRSQDIGLSSADELYNQPIDKVSESVKSIVDVEGPVHVSEVTKRVKDSCNIKRAGANLKKTVNAAIDEAEKSGGIIKIGDFLYDASDNNVKIRRREKPNIELISDEEIAESIELVLTYKKNLTTKQVAKEASRNFGFKSTSKKTASRINSVLDLMIANNKVKIDNDIVELKNN